MAHIKQVRYQLAIWEWSKSEYRLALPKERRMKTLATLLPLIAKASTELQVAPSCPACLEGPTNLIVLGSQSRAGLSDRETIVGSMGLLATQLCARLVAPLPCQALNGRHGLTVSCRLDWQDFFALVDGRGEKVLLRGADILAAEEGAVNFTRLASSTGQDAAAALEAALRMRDKGVAFVWRISGIYYGWRDAVSIRARELGLAWTGRPDWRRRTLPLAPGPCDLGVAAHIAGLVQQAAGLAGEPFDALHLRRSDAKFECPTDPERDVATYLNCADSLRRAPMLLVFTDETEPEYLRRIYRLEMLTRADRRAESGEKLVQRALANYTNNRDRGLAATIYLVGKELQGLAKTRFEMSRSTCRTTVLGGWADEAAHETAAQCEKFKHTEDNITITTALAENRIKAAMASGATLNYTKGANIAIVAPNFRKVRLFIGILTAASHVEARETIRSTWLTYAGEHVHCFVVGLPYGELLERENATTGDLVLVALRDHYAQKSSALPLKSTAILWLAHRTSADFALKTDDDSFVHVPHLMAPLASYPHLFYGGLNLVSLNGVNGVRHHLHPGQPQYNQGGGYVISHAAIACMLTKTAANWHMQREDVFVGLLARDCSVAPTPIAHITLCDRKFIRAAGCRGGAEHPDPADVANLTVRHKVPPDALRSLWRHYYGPNAAAAVSNRSIKS